MNARTRLSCADVFYFGSLATIIPGILWDATEPKEWVIAATLLVLVVLPALVGTTVALILAEGRIHFLPYAWAIIGAIAGTMVALGSLVVVYDAALLLAGGVAWIGFLPSLIISVMQDKRPRIRAARLAAPVLIVASSLLLPYVFNVANTLQVYGLWSVSALPLIGASIMAPVSSRLVLAPEK